MIHDKEKKHGFKKIMIEILTNKQTIMDFFNDQIWTLIPKVLIIFCWINVFFS
jgi:hypothetical protein